MIIDRIPIEGLVVFTPKKHEDTRGYFRESFNARIFQETINREVIFVQDNESQSKKHVIRGLHFQAPPHAQGKLVQVVCGSVIDVAVDIRKHATSYLKWHAELLSAENGKIFWIPEGFAHGFVALEDNTKFVYKCTAYYHPQAERTLLWNDPQLAIEWQVQQPIISSKDMQGTPISDFISPF